MLPAVLVTSLCLARNGKQPVKIVRTSKLWFREGTSDKVYEVDLVEALADSTVRLDQILRKIDEGEGTLGALVNDPAVYEDLRLLVSGARRSALLRTLIDYVRPEDGN